MFQAGLKLPLSFRNARHMFSDVKWMNAETRYFFAPYDCPQIEEPVWFREVTVQRRIMIANSHSERVM